MGIKFCLEVNPNLNVHFWGVIILTNTNTSSIHILFMHVSKQLFSFCFFSLWQNQTENTHTHIKALLTSLCTCVKPSIKSTPPFTPVILSRKCSWSISFPQWQCNIYFCLCVPLFQFSVSGSTEMQFCVIYPERFASTQPHIAFWTLELHSCFIVFSGTCTSPSSLTGHRPMFVVSCVKSCHFTGGWCLCFLSADLSLRYPHNLL